ncbi:MAG: endonuclease/exonuclease/phosphatase family protein [Oscillospiraceae bacterium]|nr:endonuclease/exonuclease/phosphatase family protein [Oscillospiraceae bacterium]
MKLLTLNTHSLVEEDYPRKLKIFTDAVSAEKPDIIALQEVNQSRTETAANTVRYFPADHTAVIRRDNHVLNAAKLLPEYFWTWVPIKLGYGRFDEGIALMSRSQILETAILTVSADDDYSNWKTRKILGIRTKARPKEWFFSVHYGRWDDEDDPFSEQWERTLSQLDGFGSVWLMGDFNNPAEVRGEGYDLMKKSGFRDCFTCARFRDEGFTADGQIDGWKDKRSVGKMRIDQIWHSGRVSAESCFTVFNGENYPVISDHFGVLLLQNRK